MKIPLEKLKLRGWLSLIVIVRSVNAPASVASAASFTFCFGVAFEFEAAGRPRPRLTIPPDDTAAVLLEELTGDTADVLLGEPRF